MTKFLASVNGVQEAEIALLGGADIIDLRNPADGALGVLEPNVIRDVIAFIAGRKPVSVVCGNVPMDSGKMLATAEALTATGADYLRIGFFPGSQMASCIRMAAPLGQKIKLIAVLFVDKAPDFTLLPLLAENGFYGVMLDTAQKDKGRLLQHLPHERVARFVEQAAALGLKTGLAGSLEMPDVPRLLPLRPDFLGFRSALCGKGGRRDRLDDEAFKRIRSLIPQEEVNPRVECTGSSAPEANPGTDRIFVHEFVLPVEIGAYSFERNRTQKVRFDVTAEVRRDTKALPDIQHIVSYDIIMDGIRAVVARGHVDLAETLAEQVAAYVLSDHRVLRVVVRVEKLEIAPGRVGVEIERTRPI